jgi:short-subunit dehydrogenase
VQSLCPQGVRTPMLASSGEPGRLMLDDSAIEPSDVAEAVVAAMAEGRFLILPHPEVAQMYAGRAGDPDRWLGRMNKFQQRLDTLA